MVTQRPNAVRVGALILVALVLFALAFVAMGWNRIPASRPDSAAESGGAAEPRFAAIPRRESNAAPAATRACEPRKGDNSGAAEKTAAPKPPQSIWIRFESLEGKYVAGMRFRFAALDSSALAELQNGNSDATLPAAERCPLTASGSQAGMVELRQGVDFQGEAAAIRMFPLTSNVAFDGAGATGMALGPGEFAFLVPLDGAITSVRIIPTRRIFPAVTYADQSAFTGTMQVEVEAPQLPHWPRTQTLEFKEGERPFFDLPRVPCTATLEVASQRKGFETSRKWQFAGDDIAQYLPLVIAALDSTFVLAVNLEKWLADEAILIEVRNDQGHSNPSLQWVGRKTWEYSTEKPGYLRNVFVRVSGPSGIWEGEKFTAEAGKRREFVAAPARPFTIRAKFLDAEGNPITSACINARPSAYAEWMFAGRLRNDEKVGRGEIDRAYTAKGNAAALGGLFPGTMEIAFEGDGYELERRWVTGAAGEVVDVGEIVLQRAKGRIEVKLEHGEADRCYDVALLGPGGPVLRQIRETKEPSVVFEGVASRPYVVFVQASHVGKVRGGRGVNVNADLVSESTRVVVDLREVLILEDK